MRSSMELGGEPTPAAICMARTVGLGLPDQVCVQLREGDDTICVGIGFGIL